MKKHESGSSQHEETMRLQHRALDRGRPFEMDELGWPAEGLDPSEHVLDAEGARDHPEDRAASDADVADTGSFAQLKLAERPLDAAEERALIAAARGGDMAARARIVRANGATLKWMSRRYRGLGVPLEDVISEGVIGLLTALDRYDVSRGTRFDTYARWWVLDAMRACVLRQSRVVRLPASVIKEIRSIDREIDAVKGSAGPEVAEQKTIISRVARRLDRSSSDVNRVRTLKEPVLSLDTVNEQLAEGETLDKTSEHTLSPEGAVVVRQVLAQVFALMSNLSERERSVLISRYGLETGAAATLDDIGNRLGVTAERVRQIQNEAILKLRQRFIERDLLPAAGLPAVPTDRKPK